MNRNSFNERLRALENTVRTIRQYIGARYVPKFDDDGWNDTTQYEELTVVDNGAGTSYISGKPVPPGTPLTNREYWHIYGASSGAVINLQNQIDDMKDGDVEGSLQNQINEANSSISALAYYLNNRKAIVLADSYGSYKNANNENMADIAGNLTGIPIEFLRTGGTGFVADGVKTFLALIATSTSNPDDITDIIVCGGANDYSALATAAQIKTAISTFCTYCRTTFPNLKKIVIMAESIVFGSWSSYKGAYDRVFTANAYQDGAIESGAIYVTNSQYIMHDTRLIDHSDWCHPTADGVDAIGHYLASIIMGADSINVTRLLEFDQSAVTFSTEMDNVGAYRPSSNYVTVQYMQNSHGRMTGKAGELLLFNFALTSGLDATLPVHFVTLDESLFSTFENQDKGWSSIIVKMYTNSNLTSSVITNMYYRISNNRIYIMLPDSAGGTCYGVKPLTGDVFVSTD